MPLLSLGFVVKLWFGFLLVCGSALQVELLAWAFLQLPS